MKLALEYLQKAAEEHEDADALDDLGECYYDGEGVMQDYKRAFGYFLRSYEVDDEHPGALFHLVCCYCHGHGVAQDLKKATQFWSKGAKLGCTD